MKASFALVLIVLLACLSILVDAAPANETISGKRPREPKPKTKKHKKGGKKPKEDTSSPKEDTSSNKFAGLPKGPFRSTATECGAFFGLKYACNVPVTSNMMAAAISQYQWVKVGAYGASIVCGKTACVSAHGKTIKVTIKDQYLNGKSGMLDLAPEAWNKLADANDIHQGHINMEWDWC
ncbi:hypothetical protein BC937DRAFT_91088 [Endogone sp. FLAS-F59071]|nr:hypothetical protein BC937DRAFT_91088 [Endogone sp. FLAS-F59071]|eukprot:RUS16541.1 hypothetical protein BC937DRAFT_91088 [Endogone sp. FLAS-F59071]